MGRTRKESSPADSATRQLDPKSKAIDKARARQARESAKKSYKEDSESDSDIDKLVEVPDDKDFSGAEGDPSPSESGSDWAGESSGSEYGKKKSTKVPKGRGKKVVASPKKGGSKGRGRGRPAAKGRASTGSKNGSKKGPAKRRRDDSDESEESEGESSGSEYGKKAAPKKRGSTSRGSPAKKRATASPAAVSEDSGRRRGRASVSKSYKEVSDEDFSEEEVEVKKIAPKSKAPQKPAASKKGKAKEKEESEEEPFSDAVSASEDDEEKVDKPKEKIEKKKASNSKAKAKEETKSDNGNKATKNGGGEKETNNAKDKDESDNESKKSDVSSKSGGSGKGKDGGDSTALKNRTETDYSSINFKCEKKSPSGDAANFRISSWNIGGIKAFLKKNGLEYIKQESPDILCLQEIKCNDKTKPEEVQKIDGYPHVYWCFSDQPGMHGVAVLSKAEPKSVKNGLPVNDGDSDDVKESKEKFSNEGRLITAEYEKFYLINAYVPNSGRGEKTEKDPKGYPPKISNGERQKFDELFRNYVKKLEETKPVIVTGDLNVSHAEIDLANPKTNERTAGFTKEEREGMTKLLEETTLFDTFRKLYPEQKSAYTFWSYMHNARQKNIGWRLDYFLISEKLRDSLCENLMRTEVYGSDHCPIVLFLEI